MEVVSVKPVLFAKDNTNYDHNGIGVLHDALRCEVYEEHNGAFDLELEYPVDGQLASELLDKRQILAKPNDVDDPHAFRIYEIEKDLEDGVIFVKATSITNDLSGNLIPHVAVTDVNPQTALNSIKAALLEPTIFDFVSDIDVISSSEWTRINPLLAIAGADGSLIDIWGGDIKRTNNTLYLYSRRGRDKVTVIRPGKNIDGFNMVVSTKGVVTKILPYYTYTPQTIPAYEMVADYNGALVKQQVYSSEVTIQPEPITVLGNVVTSENADSYPVSSYAPVDYSQDDIIKSEVDAFVQARRDEAEASTTVIDNSGFGEELRQFIIELLNREATGYFIYRNPGVDEPSLQIKADMIQLSDSPEWERYKNLETIQVSDTVDVYVQKFGVDVEVNIKAITYDSIGERVISITAGSTQNTLAQSISKPYEAKTKELERYIETLENGVYNTISKTADGQSRRFSGYTEPPASLSSEGDLWFKEVGQGVVETYIYKGGMWENIVSASKIESMNAAITNAQTAATTADGKAQDVIDDINSVVTTNGFTTLADLIASKVSDGEEFSTLYFQESKAIGLVYNRNGVDEAIIMINNGVPYIKGENIILNGNTIVDGTFTVTDTMLASDAVINKLMASGIDANDVTIVNLDASSITGGDLTVTDTFRIMHNGTPVLEVDASTGQVKINAPNLATQTDLEQIELTPGPQGVGISSVTEYYLATASSSGVTTTTTGWTTTVQSMTATNKYLWNYEKTTYTDDTTQTTTPVIIGVYGDQGATGSTGAAGKSISTITEYYLASASATGVTTATTGWTTSMQTTDTTKRYLWNYEKITYTDNSTTTISPVIIGTHGATGAQGLQGIQGIQGPQGDQGIQGPAGVDGLSSYTHIAYATGTAGQNFSTSHYDTATYIGMYVDNTPTDSTNYADYAWSLIKGADGAQGIQGPKGTDGLTPYLHIAYATNATGTAGFDTTVSAGKTYIGTYTDYTAADSTDPTKYSWSLIKGEQGDQGLPALNLNWTLSSTMTRDVQGRLWKSGGAASWTDAQAYTRESYTGGAFVSFKPNQINNAIMFGLNSDPATDANYTSLDYNFYMEGDGTFSIWESGVSVLNVATDTYTIGDTFTIVYDNATVKYYHNGLLKRTVNASSGKTFFLDSSFYHTKSSYQVYDIFFGPVGAKGTDGATTYTWIKYANDASGAGMSDAPEGKRYLGIAYNKTTATESTTATDYSWSPLYDNVQVGGRNLLQSSYLTGNAAGNSTKEFSLSVWAHVILSSDNLKKMLVEGETYTISYDMELTARTSSPTLFSNTSGFLLYSPTGIDVSFQSYTLKNLGDKERKVVTFTCPALLSDHALIAYTNRYTTDGGNPVGFDTVKFSNLQIEKGNVDTDYTPAIEDKENLYTWIKYATDINGTNMSDDPTGKDYIGIAYNKDTATESTTATDYTWSLFRGAQGIQGPQGPQGIQGPAGANGTSQYVHIRYSANSNGNPMTTAPASDTKYIGLANTTSSTAPTGYASYTWSLFKGADGSQGIQGPAGTNGQTTYTWVKYADTDTGTGMADTPSGKRYIGLAFNKTTSTESTTASDYLWSPLYDNVSVGGKNLLKYSNVSVTSAVYNIKSLDLTEAIPDGTEVTISIKGTLGADREYFGLYNSGGSVPITQLWRDDIKEDGVFRKTFNWVVGAATNTYLNIYQMQSSATNSSTIEWVKLERGNIPTDYTPAPEDIEGEVDVIQTSLASIVDDNQLTFTDRVYIKDKLTEILGSIISDTAVMPAYTTLDSGAVGSFYSLRRQAINVGIASSHATYVAFATAYTNLKTYLDPFAPKPWDTGSANKNVPITVVAATFRDWWLKYYKAADALSELIASTVKSTTDNIIYNTGNLLDNPHVTGNIGRWNATGLTVANDTFQGYSVKTLKSSSSVDVQNFSGYFDVDPAKAYEVTVWLKKSAVNGTIYVGLNILDGSGLTLPVSSVSPAGGLTSGVANFYFWWCNTNLSPTSYVKLTAYIMPTGTSATDMIGIGEFPANSGGSYNCIMDPRTRQMRLRFLNWANAGTSRDLFVAMPIVREVDPNTVKTGPRLKDDLNLTAPLPTSILMDANGITANTGTANKYARLDYRGLYILGGAIQIDGGLPDTQIASAATWNKNGTYIDSTGVYTGKVVASQIEATTLSSISANLGTVNAGTINGVTIQSSSKFVGGVLQYPAGGRLSFQNSNGVEVGALYDQGLSFMGAKISATEADIRNLVVNGNGDAGYGFRIRSDIYAPGGGAFDTYGITNKMTIDPSRGAAIYTVEENDPGNWYNGGLFHEFTNDVISKGNIHNKGTDFLLGADRTDRGNTGASRALVKDGGGVLVINYGNDFYGGVNVQSTMTANTFKTPSWFRSSGQSGWYNETYGATITQNENYWVDLNKSFRTYNDIATNRIVGASVGEVIKFGWGNYDFDLNSAFRIRTDGNTYIRLATDGTVSFVAGATNRHVFYPNGTKTGGTIEVDGRTLGMSPIDSPQMLLEYIDFDIPLTSEGTKVFIDDTYLKTVENFAIFPNNGVIVEKGLDYFIIKGEGVADCRIIGERVSYGGIFYDEIDLFTDERGIVIESQPNYPPIEDETTTQPVMEGESSSDETGILEGTTSS